MCLLISLEFESSQVQAQNAPNIIRKHLQLKYSSSSCFFIYDTVAVVFYQEPDVSLVDFSRNRIESKYF